MTCAEGGYGDGYAKWACGVCMVAEHGNSQRDERWNRHGTRHGSGHWYELSMSSAIRMHMGLGIVLGI